MLHTGDGETGLIELILLDSEVERLLVLRIVVLLDDRSLFPLQFLKLKKKEIAEANEKHIHCNGMLRLPTRG